MEDKSRQLLYAETIHESRDFTSGTELVDEFYQEEKLHRYKYLPTAARKYVYFMYVYYNYPIHNYDPQSPLSEIR